MAAKGFGASPRRSSYDVVIIGGAIMGSSTAWWLTQNPDFDGSILVLERDPSYAWCSTAHTNSCIRQQFSMDLNIRMSQFTADFIRDLRANMGGDDRVPNLTVQNYGYLYLADSEGFADVLRANQQVQLAAGAETELLTADQIAARYPFYQLDDIVLGSINTRDEGYWDGGTLFEWFRRKAMEQGAEYVAAEVTGMTLNAAGTRVDSVTLACGEVVSCGHLVNASGPRAARTAAMAGIDIPVEPRKRYTWVFTAENPIDMDLPLTIDPSGVHVRQDGPTTYLAGSKGDPDPAADPADFTMDHGLWENTVWPAIASRIPQFEAIRVINEWTGQYAYNLLDQNAILGPHDRVENFLFQNGFSGHGLQQSPAMGRGMSELITYGGYRTFDLSPFAYDRIAEGRPILERAVI
ncbi:FAD-binding oxidoreductase [Loktanella sp. IMCC34160]|uniref:NAD(P)/FAD-dependent oxidoreductase n=1 Tax=Loktanella sp. IMCC34160 TaxID=2510646 RepID=UPI00101CA4E9|nr:FAD-binding oxidoreductase [Loktanella sp. IMCC34160]RYG90741.1 FAD-binding oxidoreductase [Loktanella sp. IMCC34160]